MRTIIHCAGYVLWLIGQVIVATWAVVSDAFKPRSAMDPCVVAYPLRVTSDRDIAAFSTSITMTPGTLSLGILEEDDPFPTDIAPAREPHAAVPAADGKPAVQKDGPSGGKPSASPRWLLVHAVFGTDPDAIMRDLADMEQRMAPHVKELTQPGKEWQH